MTGSSDVADPPLDLMAEALHDHLAALYGEGATRDVGAFASELLRLVDGHAQAHVQGNGDRWDSGTSVLITYADTVRRQGEDSLRILRQVVADHLHHLGSIVHVLPFLRSTSDGGFAVVDHSRLEDRFGDWDDLSYVGELRPLMADLVLNHISSFHPWVRQFRRGAEPGQRLVLAPTSRQGWDEVVRPRSSSLFTDVSTGSGPRPLWTTFGPDQVDLDWRQPDVLRHFCELMLQFCRHGVRWIRLDAVGFLWKTPHTSCIHLPEAHRVVKVLRLLLERAVPGGVMVSETNVPEEENLSYVRPGDEAHLAYNFPLPPLLLEALISGRADLLNRWLVRWPDLPAGTGLLNFSACHDGVGLRPLEGLMEEERLLRLLQACEQRGGLVSHRRLADGRERPYEINISWWSAMEDRGPDRSRWQQRRFLVSQLLMMALQGVPAFYLPALLASENDRSAFARTGQRRDLHRERFDAERLERLLADPEAPATINLRQLSKAMAIRRELPAFHPESPMVCLSGHRPTLVVLRRGQGEQTVWAVHSLTAANTNLNLNTLLDDGDDPTVWSWVDRLQGRSLRTQWLPLAPYEVFWLQRQRGQG